MLNRDSILIAIGRAYAQPSNIGKPIDADLANDIATAILLIGSEPEPKPPAKPRPETHGKVRMRKQAAGAGDPSAKHHGRAPGSKLLRCDDCSKRFLSTTGKLDATCPKCGSIHVS